MKKDLFLLKKSRELNIQFNGAVRVDLEITTYPFSLEAQITGRVTHQDYPIPGATVAVLDSLFLPVTHALTDQDGTYRVVDLHSGLYRLTATSAEYRAADITSISLQENQRIILNIELKKDPTAAVRFFWCSKMVK